MPLGTIRWEAVDGAGEAVGGKCPWRPVSPSSSCPYTRATRVPRPAQRPPRGAIPVTPLGGSWGSRDIPLTTLPLRLHMGPRKAASSNFANNLAASTERACVPTQAAVFWPAPAPPPPPGYALYDRRRLAPDRRDRVSARGIARDRAISLEIARDRAQIARDRADRSRSLEIARDRSGSLGIAAGSLGIAPDRRRDPGGAARAPALIEDD